MKYIFVILLLISCSSKVRYQGEINLSDFQNGNDSIIIHAPDDYNRRIHILELHYTGYFENEIVIKLGHEPYSYLIGKNYKGIIEDNRNGDWYSREALIKIEGLENVSPNDSLKIEYKFK